MTKHLILISILLLSFCQYSTQANECMSPTASRCQGNFELLHETQRYHIANFDKHTVRQQLVGPKTLKVTVSPRSSKDGVNFTLQVPEKFRPYTAAVYEGGDIIGVMGFYEEPNTPGYPMATYLVETKTGKVIKSHLDKGNERLNLGLYGPYMDKTKRKPLRLFNPKNNELMYELNVPESQAFVESSKSAITIDGNVREYSDSSRETGPTNGSEVIYSRYTGKNAPRTIRLPGTATLLPFRMPTAGPCFFRQIADDHFFDCTDSTSEPYIRSIKLEGKPSPSRVVELDNNHVVVTTEKGQQLIDLKKGAVTQTLPFKKTDEDPSLRQTDNFYYRETGDRVEIYKYIESKLRLVKEVPISLKSHDSFVTWNSDEPNLLQVHRASGAQTTVDFIDVDKDRITTKSVNMPLPRAEGAPFPQITFKHSVNPQASRKAVEVQYFDTGKSAWVPGDEPLLMAGQKLLMRQPEPTLWSLKTFPPTKLARLPRKDLSEVEGKEGMEAIADIVLYDKLSCISPEDLLEPEVYQNESTKTSAENFLFSGCVSPEQLEKRMKNPPERIKQLLSHYVKSKMGSNGTSSVTVDALALQDPPKGYLRQILDSAKSQQPPNAFKPDENQLARALNTLLKPDPLALPDPKDYEQAKWLLKASESELSPILIDRLSFDPDQLRRETSLLLDDHKLSLKKYPDLVALKLAKALLSEANDSFSCGGNEQEKNEYLSSALDALIEYGSLLSANKSFVASLVVKVLKQKPICPSNRRFSLKALKDWASQESKVQIELACSVEQAEALVPIAKRSFQETLFIAKSVGLLSDLNFYSWLAQAGAYRKASKPDSDVEDELYWGIQRFLAGNPEGRLLVELEKKSIAVAASEGHPSAIQRLCRMKPKMKSEDSENADFIMQLFKQALSKPMRFPKNFMPAKDFQETLESFMSSQGLTKDLALIKNGCP